MPAPLTTQEILAKARWLATKRWPYLARALWAATFIESKLVPTMGVDERFRVYVNPDHIAECMREGFDAVLAGVVHEVLHPTLRHARRGRMCNAIDHARWNRCGDAELVQSILAQNVTVWSKDITPQRMGWPTGLSAEEYYRLDASGQPNGKPGPCSGGSGAHGGPPPIWETADHPNRPAGLDPAEAEIVRAIVAEKIREHAAHGIGTVAVGLLRWAETAMAPPPIEWSKLAAAKIAYHVDTRRGPTPSYARPSRRQGGSALILPSYRTPRANVTIVGDTSASMDDEDVSLILGTVYDAVEVLGSVHALGCDTRAADPVEVRNLEDLRAALTGGGGTDMSAGIERAAEDNPDAIVVVTDGGTGWPAEAPAVPVIIVLTREPGACPTPAWADVVDASSARIPTTKNV